MRKPLGGLVSILLILAITTISWKSAKITKERNFKNGFSARELLQKYISNIYESAHLQESGLGLEVFNKAVTGFMNLKAGNMVPQTSFILTVVDLAKSSHQKRMWVVDLLDKQLVLNTYAAHGHGSGDDMATSFSNKIDSHQSSLGFYITGEVYHGGNGRSLKLDGVDAGFNSNARERAIVVHGADYVGENAIYSIGRLGRSYGCPAVPVNMAEQVINTIKDKTVMFINGNDGRYTSKYLDEEQAANYVFPESSNGNVLASM
ncbi:murein L,D-transpeptidase catalytic domain family protein [Mucilaginibacter sp.]|uniref:murein L,D-transpeptidase catalytic domain family protein n=1 Tax=Mucilaginibacter sp. TaxID=1882438 RepID=UPI0025CBFBD2|nr:murein L,D-transpeptidase catalytic domain family protein [Mucilaginibacter sp.]